MPEHFHLLIKPEPAEQTSAFMQELMKRTAQRIIASLSGQSAQTWCRPSAITCAKMANFESERCRRRGKTQRVMKNQRSDSDMRVIITLGSNLRILNSRSPPRAAEERKNHVPLHCEAAESCSF
jgi:hypothetical protein